MLEEYKWFFTKVGTFSQNANKSRRNLQETSGFTLSGVVSGAYFKEYGKSDAILSGWCRYVVGIPSPSRQDTVTIPAGYRHYPRGTPSSSPGDTVARITTRLNQS